MDKQSQKILNYTILVAALGYFVDIYDLILFNVVKKESLSALGLTGESNEIFLFNCQMAGMLFGGILWGVLGDKKGRLSVLFGSILMYSLANISNAFVQTLDSYAGVRFIAGLGLAGELGAGITLVVETMSIKHRGYGTMLIVTFGALGAVFASLVGHEGTVVAAFLNGHLGYSFVGWQMAYLVGGSLGLILLALRIGTFESLMYLQTKKEGIRTGDLVGLFKNKKLRLKYFYCILIGLPVWFIVGILIAFCVPISKELGIADINTATAIMYTYIGLSGGDLVSGFLSQYFKSRKRVIIYFLISSFLLTTFYLFPLSTSTDWFYWMCLLLGAATGYWALFVTMTSESFGTNIRSTVTNTVPNFVRGAVIPLTLFYKTLFAGMGDTINHPRIVAAGTVGVTAFALAWWGISRLKDSFHEDLNYVETL